jgi:membrane protease YdiL (CAAX protease family)
VHLPSLLPLFVLSMWLCLGYAYGGSIVVPVVMHMLFNAVNLVLVFTVGSG